LRERSGTWRRPGASVPVLILGAGLASNTRALQLIQAAFEVRANGTRVRASHASPRVEHSAAHAVLVLATWLTCLQMYLCQNMTCVAKHCSSSVRVCFHRLYHKNNMVMAPAIAPTSSSSKYPSTYIDRGGRPGHCFKRTARHPGQNSVPSRADITTTTPCFGPQCESQSRATIECI
jgi:hypothetical protein